MLFLQSLDLDSIHYVIMAMPAAFGPYSHSGIEKTKSDSKITCYQYFVTTRLPRDRNR